MKLLTPEMHGELLVNGRAVTTIAHLLSNF